MNALLQDVRFGFRMLLKDPAFTAVAILTLAFALGANTAIFSVVNGILIRPLGYGDPDRLVRIYSMNQLTGDSWSVNSHPNLTDLLTQSKTLESVGMYIPSRAFLLEREEPELINGGTVSRELMELLEVRPMMGRLFTKEDDRWGAPATVIISDRLWKRVFAGDPRIIGRTIRFGTAGKVRTIIGVMPEGFRFPAGGWVRDIWTPLHAESSPEDLTARDNIYIQGYARMRDGVTLQEVDAELAVLAARITKLEPKTAAGLGFRVERMKDVLVKDVRPALLLLLAAVAGVLIIGCANVANLLLARAAGRRREIAVRAAMGATRGRIVVQLLVESVLLATIAGACGLLLAAWGIDVLKALAPDDIPRVDQIHLDSRVLTFTCVLSVLTGIVFGLAPAWSASKTNLNETLKEGTRGSTEGRSRNRIRNVLLTAAIALSLVLLIGSGLLLRSFLRVTGVDPGFDYRSTAVLEINARKDAYPDVERRAVFLRRVLASVAAIPGVRSAAVIDSIPLGPDDSAYTFQIEGRPPFSPGTEPGATVQSITPRYFATMGIPLLRGRDFSSSDTATSPRVIIINDTFARRWFQNANPIGAKVQLFDGEDNAVHEIVGVAGDVRYHGLTVEFDEMIYHPFEQRVNAHMRFVVSTGSVPPVLPALRAALKRVDPDQPVVAVHPVSDLREGSLGERKFHLVLIGSLAALALILAAAGIYSLTSYTVAQRTSEIGIRMALGAGTRDVFRLIVGNALRLVIIGVAIGVVAALAATRVMGSLLYGVGANDPATFVAICMIIASTALVASWVPARRAARVDPLVAIRHE